MCKGFYTLLMAQFLSALADNALLFAAIALLAQMSAPDWHTPLLQQFFVISYIVLAPFVGSFADALPKGRVMFIANAIKFIGSLSMVFGMPPLYAYGIVGIGAAAYSPAKYGILTELLPPEKLVSANGWMEGSTVMAIILGAIIGGIMASNDPYFAMIIITLLYMLAAIFNTYIPKLPIDHKLPKKNPVFMLIDFWYSFKALWKDTRGQVSLAVTTLFWGAGATLRLVVIAWAASSLSFGLEQATQLMALLAVGIAVGSVIAARYITLEHSTKVLPAGIIMGVLVIIMAFVQHWQMAALLLFIIGALAGFFVVPLNALLQHRGHELIGAGHSIAVQNFNEHIGILVMLGAYLLMVKAEISINLIVVAFGLFVSLCMTIIHRRYRHLN
ncbi:MAG: lysophospholipid transporter LplT [Methylotenera sp.]|uniref:lysophospholipid transporter LplT n=1 Tax=Methylotenera sp. TaxID=2051956 RepID=UPI0027185DA8|nr:lysophospholipid transporter LplT [Methylotenera sp.]MDO9206430.1 lysophospholipid transporter LplT [Methylotenera sp.]MDO9392703.1 lysophospholipid transporter LplT [Methylotenera sp.]MDP1521846.1 lysophospholipid transporter LplT [Methylotenera sp.]MDP2231444.1 lysophospholipid transporter LplT [Methylotenera sp.]MDP3141782.1 lysophospholipid transporter LplT [Methylotenera sp.]